MIVDNGNEWFSKTTAVIRNMHFLDWNFWMRYMFNFLWLLQLQFSLSSAPKLLYTVIHTVFNKNQINKEQHGTLSLVLVVRFKHSLGCGFLYGPMLFLAVVNHIPLDDYSEYSTLSTVVSIITSVALLNLELFGRIPWCFFESIPKLYNYSLQCAWSSYSALGSTRHHCSCSLVSKVFSSKENEFENTTSECFATLACISLVNFTTESNVHSDDAIILVSS